jgi:hypothetical protein
MLPSWSDQPERPCTGRNLPLLQHCGAGRFPVWSNVGTNANAHLVNPRNLAEAWRVLNGSTP